jgi:hypothetical protein
MAGDWIKMRVGLTNHPRVMRIAEALLESGAFLGWSGMSYGIGGYPAPSEEEARAERHCALRVTRYVTVTALLKFWGYANEHAKGDSIDGIWAEDVDEIVGVPGFAEAMEAAGWVEFDRERGGLRMPNFEEHNTSATARTSGGAERQRRYRERQKASPESDVTRNVTVTEREEKSREEKNLVSGVAEKPSRRKTKTKLPEDFEPDDNGKRVCVDAGFSCVEELLKFRNHHEAAGTLMANWQAGWRTWIDKAKTFRKPWQTPVSITVPGPTGPDPGLEKIKADAARSVPPPPEIRARIAKALEGKVH